MGYDKEVFTDASVLIDRIHDANAAVSFLYAKATGERRRHEALADPVEKVKAGQRAGILEIAYKLAVKDRDELINQYNEMICSPPVASADTTLTIT